MRALQQLNSEHYLEATAELSLRYEYVLLTARAMLARLALPQPAAVATIHRFLAADDDGKHHAVPQQQAWLLNGTVTADLLPSSYCNAHPVYSFVCRYSH